MARATRRKAAAQVAPQTTEEAIAQIDKYLALTHRLDTVNADASAAISTIEAARDQNRAALEAELKPLFLGLRAWWSVNGAAITEGKRKSTELAGALLGERTTPPSLHLGGKSEQALVAALQQSDWDELIRTRANLDKPAIIKMLGGDLAHMMTAYGFSIRQRDEFFIDRAGAKDAVTETVADAEEAA